MSPEQQPIFANMKSWEIGNSASARSSFGEHSPASFRAMSLERTASEKRLNGI